ncbi:MAG TPA: LemA family protein [Gemmatimonadaceae bacterium]|jgi:LemA protein|nr:LemA family protein [Gemmatimonadaceae bacterium]
MKRWLALLLLLPLGACGYNRIQTLDEQAASAQSTIEVQLQRRADLIPNLVNTVKGYAQHEEQVFTQVTQARAGLLSAVQTHDAEQMANANAQLTSALGRLMVTVEAYPNLKADQSFIRLQDELTGTENRIAVARTDYNQAVNAYNAYIRQFPVVITAKVTGAKPRKYFTASASAETGPPSVDFSKPTATPPATPPPPKTP